MARRSSAIPWGLISYIAIMFVIAWWIEDCLLYYVDWRAFAFSHLIIELAGKAHLEVAVAAVGAALAACGRTIGDVANLALEALRKGYDFLPSKLRALPPTRFLVWCAGTLPATFGAAAAAAFGRGLIHSGAYGLRALIALNGGFWIANLTRRLDAAFNRLLSLPMRFYSEQEAELAPRAHGDDQADDFEPIDAPRGGRNGRARRREYSQFFQGHVERIGIILGGGGARGAYQAGALKAIHEFLSDYGALHKVKVIAGSSIGAWNAMFWLGEMVGAEAREQAPIERWWKSLRLADLGELPWFYLPLVSAGLLSPRPWRENFYATFAGQMEEALGDHPPVHLYVTHADGADGAPHYATNWRGIAERIEELGRDRHPDYANFTLLTGGDGDPLELTADALFASLDLAPLFARPAAGDGAAGDDAVIAHLPIGLAAEVERCDLLFVLPLNLAANRGKEAGGGALRRIARIASAYQAALERAALRGADRVNRFVQRMERIEFGVNTMAASAPSEGLAAEALGGLREEIAEFNAEHRMLYLFTAAPCGEVELGTADFWNHNALGDAFDLMYLQTKRELRNRFFEDIEPEDPHVVMVDGAAPEIDELPKPVYRRPSEL